MNIIKRIALRVALRILDSTFDVDYKKIDKKAFDDWAFRSFDDKGWRSWFAYEDMKILKEMSFGKPADAYYTLVGRRLQLLYLFDEMKSAAEHRLSESQKKKDAAKSTNEP